MRVATDKVGIVIAVCGVDVCVEASGLGQVVLYKQENYRELLQRALDVIPAYPEGMSPDYLATLHWVNGYQSVNALSPTVLLGDFIYNNQEFGQIVITHFQDSLINNVPVEESMGAAQVELEALAQRLSA